MHDPTRRTALRPGMTLAVLVTAACLAGPAAARDEVTGDVVLAGFRPGGLAAGASAIFRNGYWAPVVVDLQTTGTRNIEADVSVSQKDLDGDTVIAQAPTVVLQPGHGPRRVWLACVPNVAADQGVFQVRVADHETGRTLTTLTPKSLAAMDILDQPLLILNLGTLPRLLQEMSAAASAVGDTSATPIKGMPYVQPIHISSMSADLLPPKWWHLEAVDYIFWDEPNLGRDARVGDEQLAALADWVRNGGTLVLGVAAQWQAVAGSRLKDILPGKLAGAGETTRTTLDGRQEGITFARFEPAPAAEAVRSDDGTVLAARQAMGRGLVVLLPAGMKFHQEWTGLKLDRPWRQERYDRLLNLPRELNEKDYLSDRRETRNLTEIFLNNIDFKGTGQSYMVLGLLFVIAYGLVSTLGAWVWLRGRNWTHHSWSVMMVCAVVASVISLMGVTVVRGVVTDVKCVAIVDGLAGQTRATARLYHGLRIPYRANVNGELPDGEYVRPRAGNAGEYASFVASDQYRLDLSQPRLEGVPIRATLKQFESVWTGDLAASVTGQVVVNAESVDRLPGEIAVLAGGSIRNQLGVNLSDCYLIRPFGGTEEVDLAGRRVTMQIDPTFQKVKVYKLSRLADGEQVEFDSLAAPDFWDLPDFVQELAGKMAGPLGGGGILPLGGQADKLPGDGDVASLLMLTVMSGYAPDRRGRNTGSPWLIDQKLGRTVERVRRIGGRHALFVGFARGKPPTDLYVGRGPARTDDCLTMYRYLVPLAPTSRPAPAEKAGST